MNETALNRLLWELWRGKVRLGGAGYRPGISICPDPHGSR